MEEKSKQKIKFYKYYFKGVKKPVIMEAVNRDTADDMLNQLNQKTQAIDMSLLEDIRIEMPIMGISKRKRHGHNFVWVGLERSVDGWMEEGEFKEVNNKK